VQHLNDVPVLQKDLDVLGNVAVVLVDGTPSIMGAGRLLPGPVRAKLLGHVAE
jgi:hypothetical protein